MPDPIAVADQAEMEVKQAARIIAALYVELTKHGVPSDEAGWLTRDYAEAMWAQAAE